MNQIHVLPSEVSDQIAAGEVVERPASVVKELVENAIDAGATHVVVRIVDGGRELIEVQDNGRGMSSVDAELCVQRHATSKISSIDDLFSVQTFGFRGEALAAISSVSEFELITRSSDVDAGTRVQIDCGKKLETESAAANVGTIFRIRNLFKPTPVRLAHLKNAGTESGYVKKEIEAFALAHPSVGFEFLRDEKNVLQLAPGTFASRTAEILNEKIEQLAEVEHLGQELKITGWVVAPGHCTPSRKHQWLLVNGRRIEDSKLAWAVREAYQQSAGIEKHLHPKFVLSLTLDPLLVDVNVHPRKLEVKFSEPGDVWKSVRDTVIAALHRSLSIGSPVATFSHMPSPTPACSYSRSGGSGGAPSVRATNAAASLFAPKNFAALSSARDGNIEELERPTPTGELRLIGQIAQRYIAAQDESGVWMFDQHALHERQRFEEFWNKRDELVRERQQLLTPHQSNLSEDETARLIEHAETLAAVGFEINVEGAVESVPSIFSSSPIDEVIQQLVDWIDGAQVGEHAVDHFLRKMLEYRSCRGAVMFGDRMEPEEMQRLLDDFGTTQWRNLCPHGRPNHWFIPFDELDAKFHR